MTIHSLAQAKTDSTNVSPYEAVVEAACEIESGKRVCDKALILTLDTTGDSYNIGFYNAGLSCSQIIALLEIAKQSFMREMGY